MKHLLIIGATSTIAHEVARVACETHEGLHLTLVGRNPDLLGQIAGDLSTRGATVIQHATEFLEADWKAICSDLPPGTPEIEACLVAHGVLPDESEFPVSPSVVREVVDSNLTTALQAINAITAHFIARGEGHLSVITSVAGDRGRQSNFLYGCTKAAKSAYLAGLQHRLTVKKHAGVTVTDLKLGMVATRMTSGLPRGALTADPTKIAEKILGTFSSRPARIYLPWFWRPIMWVIRSIPRMFFEQTGL